MHEFVATTAFGLERMLKEELKKLNITITESKAGRVYFSGDEKTMMIANMWLRTAEHVYLILGKKHVVSFDALFDFVKGCDIKGFVNADAKLIVNAQSQKSDLFSLRDLQKITKKAIIEHLKQETPYHVFEETGARLDFRIYLQENHAELLLDTSGDALFKRGYREQALEAPLKETLAAALVLQSFYDQTRTLVDPFCGSGTIAIEAAMIGSNIAPGLNRSFAFQHFKTHDKTVYKNVKKEAFQAMDTSSELNIYASDIDPKAISVAKENASLAGVDDQIQFQIADVQYVDITDPYTVLITNPPYGDRLSPNEDLVPLYKTLSQLHHKNNNMSVYIITNLTSFERIYGKKADKTRVLFNGNIKTRLYQYFGPKPPRT